MYRVGFFSALIFVLTIPRVCRSAAGHDSESLDPQHLGSQHRESTSLDVNRIGPASPFEDPPAVFSPARERSEAEEDRILASALYAHGRLLMKREDFAGALRRYQRAWRYDPHSVSIVRDILPMAQITKRPDELSRFMLIAVEAETQILLDRTPEIVGFLAERGDVARALRLSEKWLELTKNQPHSDMRVLMHYEIGRWYLASGDFEKSTDSFSFVRDALENPDRYGLTDKLKKTMLADADRMYSMFAESYLHAGRLDDAEQLFHKANNAKQNDDSLAMNLARIEAQRGNFDTALEKLKQFLATGNEPNDNEPYELLELLLKKKDEDEQKAMEELRAQLNRYYEQKPNVLLGNYLAAVARKTDQLELAEEIHTKQLKDKPSIDTYQGLVDIYRRRKNIDKLLEILGQTAEAINSLDVLGNEGRKVIEDKELVDKLIDAAQQRRKDGPDAVDKGVALAVALLAIANKRWEDADALFELALPEGGKAKEQLLLRWGLELLFANEYQRASRIFQRAIDEKVVPVHNLDFYYYLAGALEMSGQTDEALARCEKAISLIPKSKKLSGRVPWIDFHSRLPWILYHAKRHEKAEEQYKQLIDRFDDDHSISSIRDAMRDARLVLSNICVFQERMSEAEEWIEQVLDEFPEDIGALNDLGYLWADQNKHLDRALHMARRAVEGEPDNPAYRDSLGWAYYRLGRYDEAVKELEKAADTDDPDGVILDHLGDTYLKTNQTEKAIATWRRAVQSLRKHDDLKLLQITKKKISKYATE